MALKIFLAVVFVFVFMSFYNATYAADNTTTSTVTSTSKSVVEHANQAPPGARAPSISVSNSDVCVSGVSGGAQTSLVGLSFGATLIDVNCERIKLSRELRKSGMKVASVALLCQDPRVFQAMIMSGTPCPAKGQIGKEAAKFWNSYPELRPDFKEYLNNKRILIEAGYINEDGSLVTEVEDVIENNVKSHSPEHNWNEPS